MSIYGTSIIENNMSPIENYIDKYFLESVLNESSFNVNRELKKIKKKDDATVEDFKKILDQIKKINDPKDKEREMKEFNKYYCAAVSGYVTYIVGAVGVIAGELTDSAALAFGGIGLAALGVSIEMYNLVKANNVGLKLFEENYKIYNAFMKSEAKAKKELDKAKKLDKTEVVNKLEKFIELCEQAKKDQKTQMYNKSNYEVPKEKFKVNESDEIDEYFDAIYEDTDVLLEFKGNKVKTNIFIQILDDVDKMFKTRVDIIETFDQSGMKVINMTKKVDAKNLRDTIEQVRLINDQTKKEINKIEGYYPEITTRSIKDNARRFSNKYSEVTMAEKKKLEAKLEEYKKIMQKFGEKYEEESAIQKDWVSIIERMHNDDIKGAYGLAKYPLEWYKQIIDYVNDTIELINSIEKILNIEKTEKKLLYKVLNFKALRAEKKAQKENM